jgi:hypothetical protein
MAQITLPTGVWHINGNSFEGISTVQLTNCAG